MSQAVTESSQVPVLAHFCGLGDVTPYTLPKALPKKLPEMPELNEKSVESAYQAYSWLLLQGNQSHRTLLDLFEKQAKSASEESLLGKAWAEHQVSEKRLRDLKDRFSSALARLGGARWSPSVEEQEAAILDQGLKGLSNEQEPWLLLSLYRRKEAPWTERQGSTDAEKAFLANEDREAVLKMMLDRDAQHSQLNGISLEGGNNEEVDLHEELEAIARLETLQAIVYGIIAFLIFIVIVTTKDPYASKDF